MNRIAEYGREESGLAVLWVKGSRVCVSCHLNFGNTFICCKVPAEFLQESVSFRFAKKSLDILRNFAYQ